MGLSNQTELMSSTDSQPEPEVVAKPEPEPEPVAKPEPEPVAKPEPEPVAKPEPEPEPDLTEQLADQNRNKEVRDKIFIQTGQKIGIDDPVIQLVRIQEQFINDNVDAMTATLEATSENVITNIEISHGQLSKQFDIKLENLNDILSKLDRQKEAIVLDVWNKLERRMIEKIQTELTRNIKIIAKNSNNNINNERMMLRGALIGGLIGIAICFLILFLYLMFIGK